MDKKGLHKKRMKRIKSIPQKIRALFSEPRSINIRDAVLWDLRYFLKFFNPPNALRLGMVISLLWTINAFARIPWGSDTVQVSQEEMPESEIGMGMTYFDTPIFMDTEYVDAADTLLGGVLEPEEYSRSQMVLFTSYKVVQGDTIGGLAIGFGLNQDTLISINNIQNSRLLQIGQVIRVPNQDGLSYTVKRGDTLASIGSQYQVALSDLQTVNELFSEQVNPGSTLFIPGARLNYTDLQEINGDLFTWPVRGYISSLYGYRANPFPPHDRQFHTGLDIAAPLGTRIKAAMAGRVSATGYNASSGNYVIISHHSGYRTHYAHLNVIRVKSGAYVGAGDWIGDVGSTGLSTGAHLHFTVYKNWVTVNPRNLLN